MYSIFALGALASALFLALLFIIQRPPKSFPPGPVQLPIVGNLFNGPIPGLQSRWIATLKDKYGPVVGFKNFGVSFVVTQEPEITAELFVKNGPKVNSKPSDGYLDAMGGRYYSSFNRTTGIAMVDGDRWRENRRFSMMTVFGADKIRKLDHKIHPEINAFVDWLDGSILGTSKSQIMNPHELFPIVTLNVIGAMCADVRANGLGRSVDPEASKFANNIVKMMAIAGSEQSAATVLNRSAGWARSVEKFGFPEFLRIVAEVRDYIKMLALEREADIKQNGLPEVPSIMDLLVAGRLQDPEFAHVEVEELVGIMSDIFAGGTDTTSITLNWLFAELANHPEEKATLVKEIEDSVGFNRLPTFDELNTGLPYLDAAVHETFRHHPIVQLGAPALVTEPISLRNGNYEIPEGSWALLNIWGMQHDSTYWPEPMRWNPQRWIDDPELKKSPAFVPFKMGMRSCIGRFLAIVETKLVTVALLQRFDFQHPQGPTHKLDVHESDLYGLNKPPLDMRIKVIRRE